MSDTQFLEKMKLYDNICGACMVNTYSESKDGRIILKNFNEKLYTHMFEFEVARILQYIYRDRQIYLNMPFFKYLKFKVKYRKLKLKWISNKESQISEFDIDEMLKYVATAYEVDFNTIYKEIYNSYWRKKKIV